MGDLFPASENSFIRASFSGNSTAIEEYLSDQDADVNLKDSRGNTALSAAISSGHRKVAQLLIAANVDLTIPDSHSLTPLQRAITKGEVGIVEDLLAYDHSEGFLNSVFPNGKAAVEEAISRNKPAELQRLIDADVNAGTTQDDYDGYPAIFQVITSYSQGYVPEETIQSLVELLVNHSADLNVTIERARTPLMRALQYRCPTSVIDYLVTQGSLVNAVDDRGFIHRFFYALRSRNLDNLRWSRTQFPLLPADMIASDGQHQAALREEGAAAQALERV